MIFKSFTSIIPQIIRIRASADIYVEFLDTIAVEKIAKFNIAVMPLTGKVITFFGIVSTPSFSFSYLHAACVGHRATMTFGNTIDYTTFVPAKRILYGNNIISILSNSHHTIRCFVTVGGGYSYCSSAFRYRPYQTLIYSGYGLIAATPSYCPVRCIGRRYGFSQLFRSANSKRKRTLVQSY